MSSKGPGHFSQTVMGSFSEADGRIAVAMEGSVIVPVYRGSDSLEELVERLRVSLPGLFTAFEVILVDDGSPDNSWNVIIGLAERYSWVRGINLKRNYGQHNATLCGVRAARYGITITMDQDLQHPPEQIGQLMEPFQHDFDVVYGAPRARTRGFWRNALTSSIKRLLAGVMGVPSVRNISAFRAFRTDLRQAFDDFRGPSLILDVLLSWGTSRFTSVPVDIVPSRHSNYSFMALVRAALLILTGYSTAPLRLASWVGFLMTLFGLGVFLYVLTLYFTAGSLPGFPFLASIIALFSGAQLFALGIFGEYLARVFDRSMDRPTYVVHGTSAGE